jgi:acyl carrier protein
MTDKIIIEKSAFIKIIKEYVKDNFLLGDGGEPEEETSFLESGIIDSTGILEMIAFLEEKFGISVDDDEIVPENMDSLKNIADFLQRKLAVTV